MRHHTKTWTFLLVLLAFPAGSVPAWSQQIQATQSSTNPSPSAEPTAAAQESSPADLSASAETSAQEQNTTSASPTTETGASPNNSELSTTSPSTGNTAARRTEFDPAAIIAKPLWGITRWVGDFNPVGKHVSAPLESAIPGFRFKGYINNVSEVNTTSTDHDFGPFGRNKDWRLQKQEERVQTELRYQANEQLEFVSINNFLFDGAYALEVGQGAPTATPNTELYTQGKRIFKEAYLRGNYGKINFTLGKQLVVWGKLDGKVIDIVNADDGRDAVQYRQGDYEWRDQGQFMGLVSIRPRAKTNISLLWNPDFQTSVGTANGSTWSLVNYAPPTPGPGPEVIKPFGLAHIGQSEAGVRVDNTFGALTVSEIYYSGFNRGGHDPAVVNGAYHFTRENKYGYSLDYGTNVHGQRFVLRSEGLFTQGQQYADASAASGEVKKNPYLFGDAIETSVGQDANKVDLMYEVEWVNIPGVGGTHARQDLIHVLDVAHSFRSTSDRLNIEATFWVTKGGSDYGGWAASYQTGWRFNDFVVASVAYNDYQGGITPTTLQSAAPFGAFRKWRNVETRIKYEF